jgi:hypothetical protein
MSVHVLKNTEGRGLMALSQRLAKLNKRVLIGVPKGKAESDGTPTALAAARTEFGDPARNQPERPFLREGIRSNYPRITRYNVSSLRAVAEGTMTADLALERMGALAAGGVKQYMAGPNFAPNAPSTIAKKGSSQPTIDHGQVRQAITHVVEEGAL